MGFVATTGVVLLGLGLAWYLAGRWQVPVPRRGARRAGPGRVDRTASRASAELGLPSRIPAAAPATPAISPAPTVQLLDQQPLAPDAALALTALANSIPRPRSVMLQLLQAGDDPVEVARVVSTDPATAALLLRTVNSAQFGLMREITSVQHAITYLGANLVRDVATHHAMAIPVDTRNLAAERIYQGLWRDSYLASGIAHALAQRFG